MNDVCFSDDKRLFLGIDTSCYTTSCACVNAAGNIVFDRRIPLVVPDGKTGLRQSDMVFMHIKSLPLVCESAYGVTAIAASAAPRPANGSYMPVFVVSDSYARSFAKLACVPYYPLTHQHGHIGAALIGNNLDGETLALHVSGGTTELLRAKVSQGIVSDITQLGGTLDLAAGQLIDRLATKLGLPFPGGSYIENLAKSGTPFKIKTSVAGLNANISGVEAQIMRSIGEKTDADIAATTQLALARTLCMLAENAIEQTHVNTILLMGGVMRNGFIRNYISERIHKKAVFAQVEYSSDNACGLAMQARNIYLSSKGETGCRLQL